MITKFPGIRKGKDIARPKAALVVGRASGFAGILVSLFKAALGAGKANPGAFNSLCSQAGLPALVF
jgi:hypothetical protein